MSKGGAEREGDTESLAGSQLWAVSTEPNVRLKPQNHEIMTRDKVGCLADEPPGPPHCVSFNKVEEGRLGGAVA